MEVILAGLHGENVHYTLECIITGANLETQIAFLKHKLHFTYLLYDLRNENISPPETQIAL